MGRSVVCFARLRKDQNFTCTGVYEGVWVPCGLYRRDGIGNRLCGIDFEYLCQRLDIGTGENGY